MPQKIAIVGVGLVGRGWSIVFARAGFEVALFDSDPAAVAGAPSLIRQSLDRLVTHGLIENADTVANRIQPAQTLDQALEHAEYVQESVFEDVAAIKGRRVSQANYLCESARQQRNHLGFPELKTISPFWFSAWI